MGDEQMQTDEVIEHLNRAIVAQSRSILLHLHAASTLPPFELRGATTELFQSALEEMDEARQLIEKVVALGGTPRTDVPDIAWVPDLRKATEPLLQAEREGIQALTDVIPPTGTEPHSEAVEHLVEHLIQKKQQRIDWLE